MAKEARSSTPPRRNANMSFEIPSMAYLIYQKDFLMDPEYVKFLEERRMRKEKRKQDKALREKRAMSERKEDKEMERKVKSEKNEEKQELKGRDKSERKEGRDLSKEKERKDLSKKKEKEGKDLGTKEMPYYPLFRCEDFLSKEFNEVHSNPLYNYEVSLLKGCDEVISKEESNTSIETCLINVIPLINDLECAYFDSNTNAKLDCEEFECEESIMENNELKSPRATCHLEESLTKETPKGLTSCRKFQRYIPTISKLDPLLIDLHKTCILYTGNEEYLDELYPLECHSRFDLKRRMNVTSKFDHSCDKLLETQGLYVISDQMIKNDSDELDREFNSHATYYPCIQVGYQNNCLELDVKDKVMNIERVEEYENALLLELSNISKLLEMKYNANYFANETVVHRHEMHSFQPLTTFEDKKALAFFRVVFEPGGSLETCKSFLDKNEISNRFNKLDLNLFSSAGMKRLNSRTNSLEEGGNDAIHHATNKLNKEGEILEPPAGCQHF